MKSDQTGNIAGRWVRLFPRIFWAVLLLATIITVCTAAQPVVPGVAPAVVAHLRPIDQLPASRTLDLAIALPLRNRQALTNLLAEIYDPASPNYHHYLTPTQFAERFGPTEKDYQAVSAFVKANGLTVTGTHPNRTLLDVNGSVAAIEKMFHVHLRVYKHPTETRNFYAPDAAPRLDLPVPVLAVEGLDDFTLPRPMDLITDFFNRPLDTMPEATGSGFRGNFVGRDFRAAYAPGVTLAGSGQAVGLFELDNYYPSDIAAYENLAGLPNVPLTNVLVDGFNRAPGGNNVEVALDIDMAIAMAPGLSQVIVYEGHTPNDILNRMATDDLAKQLSCSWSFGSRVDPVREQILQQFAAQGQSFFQSSGDYGAGNLYPPSDDPWVTSVGGTSLTTSNAGGAWASESAWSGSGGGISSGFGIPVWQNAVDMSTNQGSTTMRNVPDVACLADKVIGIVANNGVVGTVGGTSAAAPLWAGFTALANEQAAANNRTSVGFINPAIYSLGESTNYTAALHDITVGNNTNSTSPDEFFAVPGYDLVTGWGTPTGSNLISALAPPSDAMQAAPETSVAFAGLPGGPFAPAAQSFSLRNTGATAMNWTLVNTSSWFNASPPGGTLAGGESATVQVTPSAAANSLAPGHYAATLWFINVNDGFVLNRQSILDVFAPTPTAPGVTMTTLYSFSGGDGAHPNGLTPTPDGNFYGTTQGGGTNSAGTVFEMTTNSALTTFYAFTGGDDGAKPFSVLTPGANGSFYGTTFQGGSDDNGTVFRVTTNGVLTTLLAFDVTNGDLPYAGLTPAPYAVLPPGATNAGEKFYGTTYQGGAYGRGTVFRMDTNGDLTTLYSFANGSDGGHIAGGLIWGSNGNFYGTTYKGGVYGEGTVFEFSPNGLLTTLVSFNGTNGAFPFAGLASDLAGNFYGVASQGGKFSNGAIFKVSADGQITNLYSFTGGDDGANPRGALRLDADGNFYGTTANGGAYDKGTVFAVSPDGALTTLAQFNGFNGANPQAALAPARDGFIYGATQNGGVDDKGVIFQIGITSAPQITSQPASQFVFAGTKVQFSISVLGSAPLFYQWQKNGTNLTDGGNTFGVNSRLLNLLNVTTNDTGIYSVIVTNSLGFTNSVGAQIIVTSSPPFIVAQPTNQSVTAGATATLSVTALGNQPLFYQWQKNGTNLADGGNVSGSATAALTLKNVTAADNATYTVAVSNALGSVTSSNAVVTVVAVSAPGTLLSTLHWFGTNTGGGWPPNGLMQASDGQLYGTTQFGSAASSSGLGTIFKMTTNGQFTTLISFSGTTAPTPGSVPLAALVQDRQGNFYGTTEFGGTNGAGNVFKLTPDNTFVNLYSFTGGSDGNDPNAALVLGADGNLYGVTPSGGDATQGNIFEMTPAGAFTNLYSFTGGADGGTPVGALLPGADGKLGSPNNFYGLTSGGGAHGYGGVFKMTPAGVLTNLYSFTGGQDGYSPVGALVNGTDGSLYGCTEYNHIYNYQFYGTVFKVTTNGALTTLYALNYTDGAYPYAGLIQGSDGNFYGTTYSGAYRSNGTVFRITPDGTLTTLVTFDGFDDGAHPESTLVEGADGALYGTTTSGGPGGRGTIFRLSFTSAPQITRQPATQSAVVGADVRFSVAVFGAPPLFYQWQRDGTNLNNGSGIFGANNRILELAGVSLAAAGNYSVVVSNALGSVTSGTALLTVVAVPSFQTIQLSNGAVTLNWNAQSGEKYQVQYNSDLSSTNWINLSDSITATNGTVSVSDFIGAATQRFYRVVLLR